MRVSTFIALLVVICLGPLALGYTPTLDYVTKHDVWFAGLFLIGVWAIVKVIEGLRKNG